MKAPSPLCLRALCSITFPTTTPTCLALTHRRSYASGPEKQPPPPATYQNQPTLKTPTTQPGFRLRDKKDDDEDFTPLPLSRPIGMPNPPQAGDNHGQDTRSLKQRRDDFVDYDKHLDKRAKMTKQISKPYFRDWSNMRFHEGKIWIAPERLFKGDGALWFPNFFGRTLRRAQKGDTVEVMEGKVSVVSFVSNDWAASQAVSFCSREQNPAVQEVLEQAPDIAQRLEINYENNVLKYWILRLFGLRKLRKTRTLHEQERYFIVRRGVTDIIKEALGLMNDKGGYVYLVDTACRIRWAGSAVAEEKEKESMVKGLRRLVQEARVERGEVRDQRRVLVDAVAEVVDEVEPEPEKKAAVG